MTKFTPYILFDGNCAEAMQFYQSCLGGELTITTVGDSPMKAQMPEAMHGKVINAHLVSDALDLTASDWLLPNRTRAAGNNVCLYVSEASYADLKNYFEKLSAGAAPDTLDQLKTMPFGSYGALTDKFGVRWMFQGEADPEAQAQA